MEFDELNIFWAMRHIPDNNDFYKNAILDACINDMLLWEQNWLKDFTFSKGVNGS